MSIYGSCNFKLIMGNTHNTQQNKTLELEESPILTPKMTETFSPNILLIFKDLFKYILPNINNKEELHKYILEVSKIEENMNLNEKYICSICLTMNKNFFTKEIIEDVLEEEFHLTLMKWLKNEKYIIEEPNKSDPYKFNIYIGLLFNIITLFEIFPIKTRDLCKFHLYKNFLKLRNLIKLNINNSFPFLFSLNNLLNKWKQQIDYLNLFGNIQNSNFLGKKTKPNHNEQQNNNNKIAKIDFKDKNETDASSEEKEEFNIQTKRNKKIFFELEKNQIIFYDKDNCPSQLLAQNKIYNPLI